VLYAVCGLTAAGSVSQLLTLRVVLVLVPFLAYSAVVNDLADARIDAVNLPTEARRVLVAGTAHRRHLLMVATASLLLTLGVAAGLGQGALWVAAAGLAVSTTYSVGPVRLAERGLVASLALPACYVAVPYLLGVLAARGSVLAADVPMLVALYVGFIGRILLKDFRDVRGDALFGKRTFLVRHGRALTCRVSAGCWVQAAVLLLAVTPVRTPSMVLGTVAGTALAVWLIRRLSRDPGHRVEERLISALAIVGRGTVLVVLTPMAAAAEGVAATVTTLLTLGLAACTVLLALDMVAHGPVRATAVDASTLASDEPAMVGTRHT